MSAINLHNTSIQEALEMFYEDGTKVQIEINGVAKKILQPLISHTYQDEPFLTLVTLVLNAGEIINQKTGETVELDKISLTPESIKKLLEKSGKFLSINGHPHKI